MIPADELRAIPIFATLSCKEIESIACVARRLQVDRGDVVFFEEEAGESVFVIEEGRVKVSRISVEGKEIVLAELARHDFFGEMAVLDQAPRSATVTALLPTKLIKVRRQRFVELVREHPRIALAMMTVLSERLRHANEKIGDLALLDVYGRVARFLLARAVRAGTKGEDGRYRFRRPTQQEMANQVGATRETVSRTLGELARRGYIEISGKQVVLSEALEEEVEDHYRH